MTISIASPSVAVTLTSDAADVVSIVSQEKGFVKAAIAGLTGMLNGGSTTAVGMANTALEVAKLATGVAIANKTTFSQGLPVIGNKKD